MHIKDFDLPGVARNSKKVLTLEVTNLPGGAPLQLTALVVGGAEDGPTLAVLGGVHGDEYEGPLAIAQVFESLQPEDLKGTFVAVPACNLPAFETATRSSPVDGLNLARVFPGDVNGAVTERIAYYLREQIIRNATFLIDLHSGGSDNLMPQLCGYHLTTEAHGQMQRRVAESFGAEVIWAHPSVAEGRTLTSAMELGVPAVYTESPGGRRADADDVACYARGVFNTMRLMEMLDGKLVGPKPRYYLFGDGAVETSLKADASGLFISKVKLLDWVEKGTLVGVITDLSGKVLQEIHASISGHVIMARSLPMIHTGDMTFMITEKFEG